MRQFMSRCLLAVVAATAQATASPGPKPTEVGPDPNQVVQIAVLQAGTEHSKKGNPGCAANFGLLAGLAREAAKAKPDLIVFPEYTISGWPYPPEETINGLAETVPGHGPWYLRYKALARETHTALLGWLVEKDRGKLYNCSFLIDPNGSFVGKYRKVQANLGEQTWWGWSQGESFRPIGYQGVKYGISICADMSQAPHALDKDVLDVIKEMSLLRLFPSTSRCGSRPRLSSRLFCAARASADLNIGQNVISCLPVS